MAFQLDVARGVATLVIDNPPQNRLTREVMGSFAEALRAIGANPGLRAVLVRAEGPNFSFGGDITPWLDVTPEEMRDSIAGAIQLSNALERLPAPVVVAVQGRCLGGGFELALRGDVIIAADTAVFGHPEQTLGVVTLLGGIQRVAERAGRARAMRWALTSELVSAQDMLAAGVISQVVAEADLTATADAWIERLADGPTQAHVGHKQMLNAWADGGVEAADALIPELTLRLMKSEDARRGIASAQDALRRGVERPSLKFSGR